MKTFKSAFTLIAALAFVSAHAQTAVPAPEAEIPETEEMDIAEVDSTTTAVESATQVQGFVDFQARLSNPTTPTSGFLLNDGAVYFTHSVGAHSLNIDLPFAVNDNTSGGISVTLPTNKFQAYIDFALTSQSRLWAGQFDTPYGFELNDSKDLFFTRGGLIWNNVMPTVHAGLLANLALGHDLSLKLLLTNPADQGLLNGRNPDHGAVLTYLSDESPVNGSVGYLISSSNSNIERFLIDIMGNWAIREGSTLDVEGVIRPEEDDFAVQAQYTQLINSSWSAALRGEYMKDVLHDSDWGLRVGVNKALNEALKLKADYGFVNVKQTGVTSHDVAIAAVYSF